MQRPVWFRRDGRFHWTPCAWQGWMIIAVYVGMITTGATVWARTAPQNIVGVGLALTPLLIAVAILTDDSPRRP